MFHSQKKNTDALLNEKLRLQLGDGPMRFGPVRQVCSVADEAERRGLTEEDIRTFASIKVEWDADHSKLSKKKNFSNEQLLRVAIFSKFRRSRAIRLLQRIDPVYFQLSTLDRSFLAQLKTKTLFPCPDLRTVGGQSVFYMRPARYFPDETPADLVVDNLVYVMNQLDSQDSSSGLAFIANMEGWTQSNFSYEYCRSFMAALQGKKFPAKVSLFLILNPPSWFGKIWAIMKTVMSAKFRESVHMISDDELPQFLEEGYEAFLPDEVRGGLVDSNQLAKDFVCFRETVETLAIANKKNKSFFARSMNFRSKKVNQSVNIFNNAGSTGSLQKKNYHGDEGETSWSSSHSAAS